MPDPLVASLLILAAVLLAGLVGVPLYLRRNPVAQAAFDAAVPAALAARVKALEDALPTKADLQAELAKIESEAQPVIAAVQAEEQKLADWLKARGWNVSK